ncbi:MAG TPA: hypothetical protein VEU32_21800 [Burkholderiales bacterium]|nr:hypothetical protein [Burkholderiales bacterium]
MQRDLTLVTQITGDWQRLRTRLRQLGDEIQAGWENNAPSALDAAGRLHFLSLFIIEPQGSCRALLVLEASFDGRCPNPLTDESDQDQFINELVLANAPLLHELYASCANYPPDASDKQLREYLKTWKHRSQLFYVGCPGLTTTRINEDAQIAAEVEAAVLNLSPPIGRRAEIVREVFQSLSRPSRELVVNTPDRPFWVRHPLLEQPFQTLSWYAKWPLALVGWTVLLLILVEAYSPGWQPERIAPPQAVVAATYCWFVFFLLAAGVLTLFWLMIWWGEFPQYLTRRMTYYVIGAKLEEYVCTSIRALPSFAAILGLLGLAHWQWARLWHLFMWGVALLLVGSLIALIVWYVRLLRIGLQEPSDRVFDLRWDTARLAAVREREDRWAQTHLISVTNIRRGVLRWVTLRCVLLSIHWLARIFYNPLGLFSTQSIHFARWTIIGGGRLVFISNYGGSFGGYLGIFATLGAAGVSAIWTNTEGFPRGFLLLGDGARDEQPFKARARDSQVESLFWYRRYPRLSVATIERNAAIRMELARFSSKGFQVPEAEFDVFLRRFATPTP